MVELQVRRVSQVNDFRNVNNIQSSIITPSANYISSVDTGKFTVTSGELLFNYNIQNVGTGDSPTFAGLTLIGTLTTTELIIGSYYLNSSGLVANNEVLNSSELNGQAASYYLNAGNLNAGVLGAAYGGTGIDNPYTLTITTGNVALNQNLRTTDSPTFNSALFKGLNLGNYPEVNIQYEGTNGKLLSLYSDTI